MPGSKEPHVLLYIDMERFTNSSPRSQLLPPCHIVHSLESLQISRSSISEDGRHNGLLKGRESPAKPKQTHSPPHLALWILTSFTKGPKLPKDTMISGRNVKPPLIIESLLIIQILNKKGGFHTAPCSSYLQFTLHNSNKYNLFHCS